MTALMLADRLIGFVSTLILARILLPEDFGLVAMCTSVLAILRVMTAFGFDMVLIQRQEDASPAHYDTVWTLRFLFSAATATLLYFAAYPASLYFQQPEIVLPIQVLAFGFWFRSLESIRIVDFRKHLQFRKEGMYQLAQKITGFTVTVSLAVYLESYWALIFGMTALNVTAVVYSHIMKPYLPRPTVREARDVFSFSIWMLLSNLVHVVRLRASHFVVGRSGADMLGFYQIGEELTSVSNQVIAAANRAVFPGYSRISGDRADLSLMYLRVMAASALLSMPMGFGISGVAPIAVPVLFGPNWIEAVAVTQVLAFHGMMLSLGSNANYILLALDRPRLVSQLQAIQVLVLLPLLIVLTHYFGIVGAACSYVIATGIRLPFVFFVVKRHINITSVDVASALWRPLVASVAMYSAVAGYLHVFSEVSLVNLVAACTLGGAVYLACTGLLLAIFRDEDAIEAHVYRYVRGAIVGESDNRSPFAARGADAAEGTGD